ncbi:MAG: tetratricopeptide repeat protein [Desulfobacterales bacterium]|nr:MAG: tetratricopeptide repeat protein [Desulfobacterales bacterium]
MNPNGKGLIQQRGSTREFLFSKTDTRKLRNKTRKTAAQGTEALRTVFPGLQRGKSLQAQALKHFEGAAAFAVLVAQLDNFDRQDATSASQEAEWRVEVAKGLDKLCQEERGIWGALPPDRLAAFFEDRDSLTGLRLAENLQKTIAEQLGVTITIGIAAYPTITYEKQQVLDNAVKALDHATFFGPNSAVVFDAVSLNINGDKIFATGDIAGAVEEFKRALMLDPANVNVHNSLGVCYGLLGDYEKALLEFKTAISLDLKEAMAVYNLGLVNLLLGHRDAALDLLLQAYTMGENVFEVAYQTGRLYLEMGQPESAQKFLEHAARLAPESSITFRYLGECYEALNMTTEAVSAYRRAVKQNPCDAAALSALGHLFDIQGENPEIALIFCQESVKFAPENGLFRLRLGQLYLKQNRLDEALRELKEARRRGHDAAQSIKEIQDRRQKTANSEQMPANETLEAKRTRA